MFSRNTKVAPKSWSIKVLVVSFSFILFIGIFNYIIDPYDVTGRNILNIKLKLASDDRNDKVNHFSTLASVDNILIGSSRVYSIDPKTVSRIFGGTTYNFGVGTATVEDLLGITYYLDRQHKMPKRLFVGVDLYTLNHDLPLNKYFLRNKELNFFSNLKQSGQEDWSRFITVDITRSSFKTLKNHLFPDPTKAPRFTPDGQGYSPQWTNYKTHIADATKEANEFYAEFYSSGKYGNLDKKRLDYLLELKKICAKNNTQLILFITPEHPILIQKINQSKVGNSLRALDAFMISNFDHYYNFYNDSPFINNFNNFSGATHTTNKAGDLIVQTLKSSYNNNHQ